MRQEINQKFHHCETLYSFPFEFFRGAGREWRSSLRPNGGGCLWEGIFLFLLIFLPHPAPAAASRGGDIHFIRFLLAGGDVCLCVSAQSFGWNNRWKQKCRQPSAAKEQSVEGKKVGCFFTPGGRRVLALGRVV